MSRAYTNRKAREKIAEYCEEHNITRCEIGLEGCMGEAHHPAHLHKRKWYYDKPDELLWDRSEWKASCQLCHEKIEKDPALTRKVFGVV